MLFAYLNRCESSLISLLVATVAAVKIVISLTISFTYLMWSHSVWFNCLIKFDFTFPAFHSQVVMTFLFVPSGTLGREIWYICTSYFINCFFKLVVLITIFTQRRRNCYYWYLSDKFLYSTLVKRYLLKVGGLNLSYLLCLKSMSFHLTEFTKSCCLI